MMILTNLHKITLCVKNQGNLHLHSCFLEFFWAQESRGFIFNPIALSIKGIDK